MKKRRQPYFELRAPRRDSEDLTGQRFGKLTVVRRAESLRGARFACVCDCGATTVKSADYLRRSVASHGDYTAACEGCNERRKPKPAAPAKVRAERCRHGFVCGLRLCPTCEAA